MARTTRITTPDGNVTTIRTSSGIGCCGVSLWVLVLSAALAIPAAYLGPWALVAYVGLVALIVAPLAIIGWRSGRNTHGVPLDEPEKDAAYWAEYVARVSGNPEPPPL